MATFKSAALAGVFIGAGGVLSLGRAFAVGSFTAALASASLAQPNEWFALQKELREHTTAERFQEATATAQRLDALSERVLPPIGVQRALSLAHLGLAYRAEGRYAEAERPLRQALAILGRISAPPVAMASNLGALASIHEHQGRRAEAESLYRQALHELKDAALQERLVLARLQFEFGRFLHENQRPDLAKPLLLSSLQIREELAGPQSAPTGEALLALAGVLQSLQETESAEKAARRAISIGEASPSKVVPLHKAYNVLALSLSSSAQWDAAEAAQLHALQLAAQSGASRLSIAQLNFNLAHIHEGRGDLASAQALARQSLASIQEAFGETSAHALPMVALLQRVAQRSGKAAEQAVYAAKGERIAASLKEGGENKAVAANATTKAASVPVYPESARRFGHTGSVTVRARIGVDGVAKDVAIASSSGYASLDQAALDSVSKTSFHPATDREGRPLESTSAIPIHFKLE